MESIRVALRFKLLCCDDLGPFIDYAFLLRHEYNFDEQCHLASDWTYDLAQALVFDLTKDRDLVDEIMINEMIVPDGFVRRGESVVIGASLVYVDYELDDEVYGGFSLPAEPIVQEERAKKPRAHLRLISSKDQ